MREVWKSHRMEENMQKVNVITQLRRIWLQIKINHNFFFNNCKNKFSFQYVRHKKIKVR